MAGGQRSRTGGILGLLLDVLQEPARRSALQYDLLRAGLSLDDLGSEALTWYDLRVFVRHVQTSPDSALGLELRGHAVWSVEAQLLATIADSLAWANWQRAGKKNAPKPKPLERPWLKAKGQKFGKDAIPLSEFDDWWDGP